MRPQVQSYASSARRFRRAPSRCQIVWQGILILATLALAVAANAQSTCGDLFSGKSAPLRQGSPVTIHYSFSRAGPEILANESMRFEIETSTLRESHRLQAEGRALRAQLDKSSAGRETIPSVLAKAEIVTKIHNNQILLARLKQIDQTAKTGARLTAEELSDLKSYRFEQTVALKSKADAKFLAQRLGELVENLATYDPLNYPVGRIARIYNLAVRHRIITLILIAVAGGLTNQGYDLYVSAQHDAQRGAVTLIYDDGTGSSPIAPASSASEPIGN